MAISVSDLLVPERVSVAAEATSRKRALECLSALLAEGREASSRHRVFDQLVARERLGSTGLGFGVAIPHARVPGLREARGAFMRVGEGIDFDAPDGGRVDLIFGLAVPEQCTEEHLEILALLARLLSAGTLRESLRRARNREEALDLLVNGESGTAR